MRIPFSQLKDEFKRILLQQNFSADKAELCADIFASNSRDGVPSHGLNRFPVFINYIKEAIVKPDGEPVCLDTHGCIEHWDGQLGAGMYNATIANRRAMALAETHGFGCVTLKNTNHWMRGGTYGWQAADAGFISICFTNTIAGMPAWGGNVPVLGNNPFVIGVPRSGGHVVLDMAMSQFSYGKMQEYQLRSEALPVFGGYNDAGQLTTDPAIIRKNKRALPIGYWKGTGLSMILDILLVALSGGKSTAAITATGIESGLSQCFICIRQPHLHDQLVEAIINYTRTSAVDDTRARIAYPGEGTLRKRLDSEKNGVLVNDDIWSQVQLL